jgi:hypothetical protein
MKEFKGKWVSCNDLEEQHEFCRKLGFLPALLVDEPDEKYQFNDIIKIPKIYLKWEKFLSEIAKEKYPYVNSFTLIGCGQILASNGYYFYIQKKGGWQDVNEDKYLRNKIALSPSISDKLINSHCFIISRGLLVDAMINSVSIITSDTGSKVDKVEVSFKQYEFQENFWIDFSTVIFDNYDIYKFLINPKYP